MQDKEFTQICREILAASEKISPLAEQAGKLLEQIEQQKLELQASVASANEAARKALQGANEQAAQTLSAAQSQAEQTAKLAKEATKQNAASAKNAQQKAAEILASIEKLQEQIKATADKVENAGALITELNSLKEQIKTLLQNGIINDAAQSATQTYSSNLIERKLETKESVGYGYSKIEANAKFETLAQGITTAMGAAAAAQSSADSKLGKNDQAADSAKLGGSLASDYVLKTGLETELADKLGKNDRAADSTKLGGLAADKYAKKDDIPAAPQAATETKAGIVKLKNSITGSLSDTAVSEKAVSDVFSAGFLSSKQQNGYTKLPNGLILQWGATTSTNVIFPIAFNKRLNVSLTSAENECEFAVSVIGEALDQNTSNTGFEIGVRRIAGSPPDYFKFYWFAVGY